MEKYLVTVKRGVDINEFYDDMEISGRSGRISNVPDREVECYDRRPISRNTGYILSEEEVNLLKNDPRVIGIEPQSILDSITVHPCWTQTSSDWDKSNTSTNTNRNWGLYRCINGEQVLNWGSNETVDASATITTTSSGKNVDIVIVDGHLNVTHPEFAVNDDGTGGTRVQQFNWLSLTNTVTGGANGTYTYRSGSGLNNSNDNHGQHVAGTVAGNTQGWARDANIYYISPYDSQSSTTITSDRIFEYIRAWHNSKSINSSTGRRNPTIVNNSWGSHYAIPRYSITNVVHRGTNYSSGFTNSEFQNIYGIRYFDQSNVYPTAYLVASYVSDIEDAVNDGIIFVGAAGNNSTKIDIEGGIDYNNYIVAGGYYYYYHRGSWATAAAVSGTGGARLSVCVGAVSALTNESKATFSNCGSRVDVYAPGVNVISSLQSSGGGVTLVSDSRNSNYKLGKYNGTSMSSPQVCGVLACLLEQYQNMKQSDIMSYLDQHSKSSQITTTSGGYTDDTDIQGGSNSYLFYKKERVETGATTPRYSYGARKASTNGVKYPRVNTRVTKRI
jgi:hypothetical protein